MITAEFYTKQSKPYGFVIKGHAGYADMGDDIVCASVSSASQLVANTITEVLKIKAEVKVLNDKIRLKLPDFDINAVNLLEGLKLHLTVLSEDYEGTIKITTSEV